MVVEARIESARTVVTRAITGEGNEARAILPERLRDFPGERIAVWSFLGLPAQAGLRG